MLHTEWHANQKYCTLYVLQKSRKVDLMVYMKWLLKEQTLILKTKALLIIKWQTLNCTQGCKCGGCPNSAHKTSVPVSLQHKAYRMWSANHKYTGPAKPMKVHLPVWQKQTSSHARWTSMDQRWEVPNVVSHSVFLLVCCWYDDMFHADVWTQTRQRKLSGCKLAEKHPLFLKGYWCKLYTCTHIFFSFLKNKVVCQCKSEFMFAWVHLPQTHALSKQQVK